MSKPNREPDYYGCHADVEADKIAVAEEARAHEEGRCAGFPYCILCLMSWEEKAEDYDRR